MTPVSEKMQAFLYGVAFLGIKWINGRATGRRKKSKSLGFAEVITLCKLMVLCESVMEFLSYSRWILPGIPKKFHQNCWLKIHFPGQMSIFLPGIVVLEVQNL